VKKKEYENIRYETCVKQIFWKTELVGQGRLPETKYAGNLWE
jgi:hypothetical protein